MLAYSTVSQLGFMFLGVGVGAYWAGVFHLVTHAFFKACLFLGSGAVIHALHGEQDIFGNPWNASDYVAAVSTDSVWSGGTWRGSVWAADGWLTFGRWGTSPWTGLTDWAGNTFDNQGGDIAWDGSRWSGSRWTGSRWSGSRWSGSRWSGSRWSGSRWSGSRWSDADWN